MKSSASLVVVLVLINVGCQTFTSKDGSKNRQLFPAKDKTDPGKFDTNRFTKQAYNLSDFIHKEGYKDNRKIIEPVEGADLQSLLKTEGNHYIYFCNPTCPGSVPYIHKLDSLAERGENIMIISMRNDYNAIDKMLGKTTFGRYPYYTMEAEKYSNILLVRKIRLIKEACESCYDEYKDDVAVSDLLLLKSGAITPVMYNDNSGINILKP